MSSRVLDVLSKIGEVSTPIFLDSQLLAEAIEVRPLVSEQLMQNNRALNLDLTLGVNVLIENGFPEMAVTNVELETKKVQDPTDSSKTVNVPKGIRRGQSVVNNFVGIQSVNKEGEQRFEAPDVYYKEPSPMTTFKDGEELYYRQCLQESKQLYVLMTADSTVSGESRIQARQDFLKKIQRYKSELDRVGTWLLTTLLHMTAAVSGKNAYFKGIGVTFDSKVYAGELSAAEKNVVITMHDKGLIDTESAMVLLGVEDPMIVIDKVRADKAEEMDMQIRRLVAVSKYSAIIQQEKDVLNINNTKKNAETVNRQEAKQNGRFTSTAN